MKSKSLIMSIPSSRKAQAVAECFGDETITPLHPSSILKKHPACRIFLDTESAGLLRSKQLS